MNGPINTNEAMEKAARHTQRGVSLSQRGDKEAALDAFMEALRQEPSFTDALNNLASTFSDLGRFREALGCYQELVNRGPVEAETYRNLAHALTGARQQENALEALRRAIRLRPDFADAHNDRGKLLNEAGRHEEAIEAYESALDTDPAHRGALANLAHTFRLLQKPVPALHTYRQLHELEPRNLLALRGMAHLLAALGQTTAAIERCEQILELDPEDALSRHLRSSLRGATPDAPPPGYVRTVFERDASLYEEQQTKVHAYSLPGKVPELLERLDGPDAWYPNAVDLGCGTGLVGVQVRTYCAQLMGIDVARAMLDRAAEKAVYDQLKLTDLATALASLRFDLAIGADVLPYLGALESLFAFAAPGKNAA